MKGLWLSTIFFKKIMTAWRWLQGYSIWATSPCSYSLLTHLPSLHLRLGTWHTPSFIVNALWRLSLSIRVHLNFSPNLSMSFRSTTFKWVRKGTGTLWENCCLSSVTLTKLCSVIGRRTGQEAKFSYIRDLITQVKSLINLFKNTPPIIINMTTEFPCFPIFQLSFPRRNSSAPLPDGI